MKKNVAQRLMDYAVFDTRSDSNSNSCPSTPGQLVLGKYLVEELKAIGLNDAAMDGNGYVTATLPSNCNQEIPVIGFLAHMDTSPEISGANVKPQLVKNYPGGDIVLNKELGVILSPEDFPELSHYIGQDLITTDGTTLLGADNKAGIAEILTAMEHLVSHPEIQHGMIKVGFTPDEEIGRGADLFDVAGFGASFAYTMDGGPLGELEYETFNAAEAKVLIKGRNIHPGTAKNRMINSLFIAMELNSMLPAAEVPGHTEGYEGFYHLNALQGSVEETQLTYIIRDHDSAKFAARKERLLKIAAYLNEKYAVGTVTLVLRDQYYNMREKIEPVYSIVELAKTAIESICLVPNIKPVRGGTDGSRLSYMGLPCPNLFTGGYNFHGKYEFIPVPSMEKAVELILKIIEIHTKAVG